MQQLGTETLVYDLTTHKMYNLNETSAKVFNNCDGKTSFDELKSKYKFTDDLIYLALDELKRNNLIENDYPSPFAGMNRREVIRRVGVASLVALPAISFLVAPMATNAQSCVNTGIVGTIADPLCSFDNSSASTACNARYGAVCCSGTSEFIGYSDPPPAPCEIQCDCVV